MEGQRHGEVYRVQAWKQTWETEVETEPVRGARFVDVCEWRIVERDSLYGGERRMVERIEYHYEGDEDWIEWD
jgi:hypothetical protein